MTTSSIRWRSAITTVSSDFSQTPVDGGGGNRKPTGGWNLTPEQAARRDGVTRADSRGGQDLEAFRAGVFPRGEEKNGGGFELTVVSQHRSRTFSNWRGKTSPANWTSLKRI